jgi:hypothetical protein
LGYASPEREAMKQSMSIETQFTRACRSEREAATNRHVDIRERQEKLRSDYGAEAVYITGSKASIWFKGKHDGARYFPKTDESLIVLILYDV